MKNMIYTKGFINNSGDIEVPGVFLEEGAEVELKISVARGKFEIALLPSEVKVPFRDCGISEEEIQRTCSMYEDCDGCPLIDYCGEESEVVS